MKTLAAGVALRTQAELYIEKSYADYVRDINDNPTEKAMDRDLAIRIGLAAIMLSTADRMAHFSETAIEDVAKVSPAYIGLEFVAKEDLVTIISTFGKMLNYKVIRDGYPLTDWLAEMAWWAAFDESKFPPPVAMRKFIERVTQGRRSLDNLVILSEYKLQS